MRIDRLTSKLQLALSDAQSIAVGLDHPAIEPLHLMQALLEQQGGSIRPLLMQVGFDIAALRQALTKELDQLPKLQNPAWMQTGEALKGFWMGAVQIPAEGRPPIAFAWYREFLQAMIDAQAYTWFAKVIAISEVLIGVALIAGIFVGLTAFFGGFLNWNFIMAGSASVNGVFFGLAVLLVLAWKIAGYIGLDYFVLPRVAELWIRPDKTQ